MGKGHALAKPVDSPADRQVLQRRYDKEKVQSRCDVIVRVQVRSPRIGRGLREEVAAGGGVWDVVGSGTRRKGVAGVSVFLRVGPAELSEKCAGSGWQGSHIS